MRVENLTKEQAIIKLDMPWFQWEYNEDNDSVEFYSLYKQIYTLKDGCIVKANPLFVIGDFS